MTDDEVQALQDAMREFAEDPEWRGKVVLLPPGRFSLIPPVPVDDSQEMPEPRRWKYPVGGPCGCSFGMPCMCKSCHRDPDPALLAPDGKVTPEAAAEALRRWHEHLDGPGASG